MKFSNAQKLGLFVIVMSITLFFVINFFKGSNVFSSYNTYYTYLTDVEGLTSTSPVYIRGLKVGKIESIKLNPIKDQFLVRMSVSHDYQVPIDSKAELYSSDILGGKSLRLALGEANQALRNKDTLVGLIVPDMLSVLTSQVAPMKNKIDELLQNLNTALNRVNNILDTTTQDNLKSSVRRLNNSLSNIESVSSTLKKTTPSLESSLKEISDLLTTLNNPEGDFKNTLGNLNATSEKLASLEIDKTVKEINALLEQIQKPNTTTGKLMTTDQLHDQLEDLITNLTSLVKKIEENPKKYLKVSVF